jgi:hypothetical protein
MTTGAAAAKDAKTALVTNGATVGHHGAAQPCYAPTEESMRELITEDIGSAPLGEVFRSLASYADIVVVYSAPILPVTDTAVLSTNAVLLGFLWVFESKKWPESF